MGLDIKGMSNKQQLEVLNG